MLLLPHITNTCHNGRTHAPFSWQNYLFYNHLRVASGYVCISLCFLSFDLLGPTHADSLQDVYYAFQWCSYICNASVPSKWGLLLINLTISPFLLSILLGMILFCVKALFSVMNNSLNLYFLIQGQRMASKFGNRGAYASCTWWWWSRWCACSFTTWWTLYKK